MRVSALKHRVAVVLCVSAVVMISSCATVDRSQPQEIAVEAVVEDTQAQLVTETASPDGQQLETDVVTDVEIPATPVSPEVMPAISAVVAEPDTSNDTEAVVEALAEPAPSVAYVKQAVPPNTFVVTAEIKDPSHLYYGIGSKLGLVVNGEQGKELVVVRGQTYTFKVDTGVQHDFYLSKSFKGWGAATLTDGVKGNFTYKGIVTFTPDENTPDTVYYQCRNHKNMGSKIHVVNKGGESAVVFGVRDDAGTGTKAKVKSAFTSGNQAQQKLMFAEMFISSSPAAKRIDASDNAEARQILADARGQLAQAKRVIAGGDDAKAIAIIDEALRSMTVASQLVPSEAQLIELQTHYDELLKSAHTYEKSYRRNLKMMQKKGKKDLPDLDIDEISAMIAAAQAEAEKKQYVDANRQLTKVQRLITGALTQLLADETMDYTLTFDNPQEEYEYELSRYKSFEELIPIAIEQKHPAKQTLALMDQFIDKARGIYAMSGPKAKAGDYKTAIQMLQGATSHLQRALRIIGVR